MNNNFNVYEKKEDIEDMYEEFEDSMPCDLYGGCAGSACRNWYNCHN